MTSLHRIEELIPSIAGLGVLVIAITSFTLSYVNLVSQAIAAGILPSIAWMWPLNLDVFIVVGTLFVLRASLRNEDTRPGWAIVIIFTAVSTFFNMAHSPEGLLARISHGIPPIALMCSLEVCMMILKSDLNRTTDRTENLTENITDRTDKTERQTENLTERQTEKAESLTERTESLTENLTESVTERPTDISQYERVLRYFEQHPESSLSSCAKELGVSWGTVSRYKKKMNPPVQQEA